MAAAEHPIQPDVLVVEPDPEHAREIRRALQAACLLGGEAHDRHVDVPRCRAVDSLHDLHHARLADIDLVICDADLPDGTGIDALAYLKGIHPTIPVVITSREPDAFLAVEVIRAGAADFVVKADGYLSMMPLVIEKCLAHQRVRQENELLHQALSRSLRELGEKNQQLEAMIGRLETMARTDELTGLSNRRWLNDTLDRVWAEALRHRRPLAFVMIDLDEFKSLNDSLGHQKGDELLAMTGRVLQANSRAVDVPARYGGDEFCVLMPQTELEDAVRVAERIRDAYEEAVARFRRRGFGLAMSMGVAHIHVSRPASAEQLIHHADQAMYAAKANPDAPIMVRQPDGTARAA